jgi:A/G-specific adenine glycosylase
MLQQTQVSRVVPKWTEFIARWPTPTACATAPAAEVVQAWAGLGYNRRALNLHRCATAITREHGGQVPADLGALKGLAGVGEYTARAILAFAFNQDVGVLDVNADRVVTRAIAGRRVTRGEAQRLADALVPEGRGWHWNQVMLDFGATVCTARAPSCGGCPVERGCAWHLSGGPDPATPTSRQSRFDGSDRQGRGRLVAALRRGPVPADEVAAACGWPDDPARAAAVAAAIVDEGFALLAEGTLELRRS